MRAVAALTWAGVAASLSTPLLLVAFLRAGSPAAAIVAGALGLFASGYFAGRRDELVETLKTGGRR